MSEEDLKKDDLDILTESSGCNLKEYEYVYPRFLETHKKKWMDYDELDFIEKEIENHQDNMEIHHNLYSRWKNADFEQRDKSFHKEIDFLNFMSYCQIRIASHKKIISFLEIKKAELVVTQKQVSTIKKEKVPVIALLYFYNGQYITRDNATLIANKYGYNAKSSGEGLYQDFVYYANSTNRKASGENKIKCKNRIENQKRVIELLTDEIVKSKAITELNLLKVKLENLS